MARLEYTYTQDLLFKMIFVKHEELLIQLVAQLLGIRRQSIENFVITNPEIPPEVVGDKFCRLDINMTVDGQRVDLEIQVANEESYPERTLYYWAREFSTALAQGGRYADLPRTIVISILAFRLFTCDEYYSEYKVLEVSRHIPLSDKLCLKFFELPKLPEELNEENELLLWLMLFRAETEEELASIEALGVPVMDQAIEAYRVVTATDEFRELERQRHYAALNRASALSHAAEVGAEVEREKWQIVVAEKDTQLAEKDTQLAEKDALIALLRARDDEDQ